MWTKLVFVTVYNFCCNPVCFYFIWSHTCFITNLLVCQAFSISSEKFLTFDARLVPSACFIKVTITNVELIAFSYTLSEAKTQYSCYRCFTRIIVSIKLNVFNIELKKLNCLSHVKKKLSVHYCDGKFTKLKSLNLFVRNLYICARRSFP